MRCREITAPIGLGIRGIQVSAPWDVRPSGVHLDLIRERGRPDFDAREVTLLHRIVPHLSSGLKAAVLAKQASPSPKEKALPEYWSSMTGDGWSNTRRPPNDG